MKLSLPRSLLVAALGVLGACGGDDTSSTIASTDGGGVNEANAAAVEASSDSQGGSVVDQLTADAAGDASSDVRVSDASSHTTAVDAPSDVTASDVLSDAAVPPGATHVGASTKTCGLVSNAQADTALYLSNCVHGITDPDGTAHLAHGELHIVDRQGHDYVLAANGSYKGYAFAADGRTAIFLKPVTQTSYALEVVSVPAALAQAPNVAEAVAGGLTDQPILAQGRFSPSGRYFIAGALPSGVIAAVGLDVVRLADAADVFSIPRVKFGIFDAIDDVDRIVYRATSGEAEAGAPARMGLYTLDLRSLADAGSVPVLLDSTTAQVAFAPSPPVIAYTRTDGSIYFYDLNTQDHLLVTPSNAIRVAIGPQLRGPFVFLDRSEQLHVVPRLQLETFTLPDNAGPTDPYLFAPDGAHLYELVNFSTQSNQGALYTRALPPAGAGAESFVADRVTLTDFDFTDTKMLFMKNADTTGDIADLVASDLDGTNQVVLAKGAVTGDVKRTVAGASTDAGAPAVVANLAGAVAPGGTILIDNLRPIVGTLMVGSSFGAAEATVVNDAVRTASFEFSDDGRILAYIGAASYSSDLSTYSGTLGLYATNGSVGAVAPTLSGVSEMGPIAGRSLFVAAQLATPPGIYFVRY